MPSLVIHIWASNTIYEDFKKNVNALSINKRNFILGSIKPDMLKISKEESHFRTIKQAGNFKTIDMQKASEILGYTNEKKEASMKAEIEKAFKNIGRYLKERNFKLNDEESARLGLYLHLVLDVEFLEAFIYEKIEVNDEKDIIILKKTSESWSNKEFFENADPSQPSRPGVLYESYSRLNFDILKKKIVTWEQMEDLPEKLPKTGIKIFDTIEFENTWKEELLRYLYEDVPKEGIFKVQDMEVYIKDFSKRALEKITKEEI